MRVEVGVWCDTSGPIRHGSVCDKETDLWAGGEKVRHLRMSGESPGRRSFRKEKI